MLEAINTKTTGELTIQVASKTPKHDEIEVRYLPSTAKRGDRVKLSYRARGRSLTIPYDTNICDFERQAIAVLLQNGVEVVSYNTPDEGPTTLSIPQTSREVLARVFKIKSL